MNFTWKALLKRGEKELWINANISLTSTEEAMEAAEAVLKRYRRKGWNLIYDKLEATTPNFAPIVNN